MTPEEVIEKEAAIERAEIRLADLQNSVASGEKKLKQ